MKRNSEEFKEKEVIYNALICYYKKNCKDIMMPITLRLIDEYKTILEIVYAKSE